MLDTLELMTESLQYNESLNSAIANLFRKADRWYRQLDSNIKGLYFGRLYQTLKKFCPEHFESLGLDNISEEDLEHDKEVVLKIVFLTAIAILIAGTIKKIELEAAYTETDQLIQKVNISELFEISCYNESSEELPPSDLKLKDKRLIVLALAAPTALLCNMTIQPTWRRVGKFWAHYVFGGLAIVTYLLCNEFGHDTVKDLYINLLKVIVPAYAILTGANVNIPSVINFMISINFHDWVEMPESVGDLLVETLEDVLETQPDAVKELTERIKLIHMKAASIVGIVDTV